LAEATLSHLAGQRTRLFTTNFLVADTHALLLNRRGRRLALEFLTVLAQGDPAVLRITEGDEARAREIIFQYDDKDFSYVDATSFAVMERLGIDEGFSFDRHFRQYGWRMLPERLS
jgi:predicted nucleic acid-binding protein